MIVNLTPPRRHGLPLEATFQQLRTPSSVPVSQSSSLGPTAPCPDPRYDEASRRITTPPSYSRRERPGAIYPRLPPKHSPRHIPRRHQKPYSGSRFTAFLETPPEGPSSVSPLASGPSAPPSTPTSPRSSPHKTSKSPPSLPPRCRKGRRDRHLLEAAPTHPHPTSHSPPSPCRAPPRRCPEVSGRHVARHGGEK